MIVVGSRALKHYANLESFSEFSDTLVCSDIDLMGAWDELDLVKQYHLHPQASTEVTGGGKKVILRNCLTDTYHRVVEFEVTWPGSTAEEFVNLVMSDPETIKEFPNTTTRYFPWIVPSLNALFALKTTHRFAPAPHLFFQKTVADWHMFKNHGCVIPKHYEEWVKRRTEETIKRKVPRLNQNKAQFFTPDIGVTYKYDHDSVHRAVAYIPQIPAYTLFQKDGAEVMVDKNKFFALPIESQLHSVAEEAMVLAIERSLVPFGTITATEAFEYALSKVCTTISSGWWREFAYENYYNVISIYDREYYEKFKKALADGLVLPYKKGAM